MKFKENDLIQSSSDPNKLGVITSIDSKPTYYKKYNVTWDDGSTDSVSEYTVEKRDDEFAREFREAFYSKIDLIKAKLDLADTILSQAVELSEELGVPFNSNISPLYNSYIPKTFQTKFPKVTIELVQNLIDSEDWHSCGWKHSQIC